HQEGGRHAFAGNIGNGKEQILLRGFKNVKIVASNLKGGKVTGSNIKLTAGRDGIGEQPLLNMFGNTELFFQPFLFDPLFQQVGFLDGKKCQIAQRTKKGKVGLTIFFAAGPASNANNRLSFVLEMQADNGANIVFSQVAMLPGQSVI